MTTHACNRATRLKLGHEAGIEVYRPVQLVVGRLLCRCDLLYRRCVGAFALFIGFA
jgi:hypothetical protein